MLYFKTEACSDFDELIGLFPSNEFSSPYRSTIPLTILIKEKFSLLTDILKFKSIDKIIFEYETPVGDGKGLPSCSDLLITSDTKSIIIEAKRTEPKYETVSTWDDGTNNKKKVLSGWIGYIQQYINDEINMNDINDIPYQMIHRIASACALNEKNIEVLYLGFDLSEKMENYYRDKLNIMALLTNNMIPFSLSNIKIIKKQAQINIEQLWDEGNRNLGVEIINGIKEKKLMTFDKINLQKIGIK